MSLKLSTALRNALVGNAALPHACLVGATGDFVISDGNPDEITDSGNSLITKGFQIGDWIQTFAPATAPGNVFSAKLLSVAAGSMTFLEGIIDTDEVFAALTAVVAAKGGSLQDLFKHGVLHIYSGTQPEDANAAEGAGTLRLIISDAGGAHNSTTGENGLEFEDDPTGGVLSKLASQEWSDEGINAGTISWFRFYAQDVATGVDAGGPYTKIRFDGSIALSGAQLNVASLTVGVGIAFVINNFTLTVPAS